jgi:hypothetical protein
LFFVIPCSSYPTLPTLFSSVGQLYHVQTDGSIRVHCRNPLNMAFITCFNFPSVQGNRVFVAMHSIYRQSTDYNNESI